MAGIGAQHSKQWQPNDPVRASRLEDLNEEMLDIRTIGHDRGLVRKSSGEQVNSCDSATGWVASGVGTAVAIDTAKFLEGAGSLKIGASGAGTAIYTLTQTAQDYSTKLKLFFDLWFDYSTYGDITSVTVKIGSDASNYKSATVTINDDDYGDWKKRVEVTIASMSDTGSPDMANVDYFAIEVAVTDAVAAGLILLDDIRVADLAVDVGAFTANVGGTILNVSAISELDLADDDTNYVEVNTSGTVSVNQSGFNSNQANLAEVVTSSGEITSITVKRADVVGGDFNAITTPFIVDEVDNDETNPVLNRQLYTSTTNLPALGLVNATTSSFWFDFILPAGWSASTDIIFDLTYSASVGSNNFVMQLEYWVVEDGGDTTPASATDTVTETIAAPASTEVIKKVTTTTLKIAAADLAAGAHIVCRMSRLGSDGSDSNTGEMYLHGCQAYQ